MSLFNPSRNKADIEEAYQQSVNPFVSNGVGLQGPEQEESFEIGVMELPGPIGLGRIDSPVIDNQYPGRIMDNPDAFDSCFCS